MLPAFMPAQDFNLDPQKIYRDVHLRQPWNPDRVLLGRDDHLEISTNAAIDETLQLGLAIAMMIGVAL